jgi:hypothetical protein
VILSFAVSQAVNLSYLKSPAVNLSYLKFSVGPVVPHFAEPLFFTFSAFRSPWMPGMQAIFVFPLQLLITASYFSWPVSLWRQRVFLVSLIVSQVSPTCFGWGGRSSQHLHPLPSLGTKLCFALSTMCVLGCRVFCFPSRGHGSLPKSYRWAVTLCVGLGNQRVWCPFRSHLIRPLKRVIIHMP